MKKKEVYEDGDVVHFLKEVINKHSGRGAYNVIMARFNLKLQQKVIEMTSFLDAAGLSFVGMKTRIYMLANGLSIDDFPRCCTCGNVVKQNVASLHRGFIYHTCSVKCAANRKGRTEQIKATKLERHGNPNYNNGAQISKTLKSMPIEERTAMNQKRSQTLNKHKLEDMHFQEKITAKSKHTRLQKYGDENWNNGKQISATKQRKKNEDPNYYSIQVQKGKATRLERYGNENWNNRDKDKQTRLERYGNENWNNREQAAATCIGKYGVDNPAKAEPIKQQIRDTCLEAYGATCFLASSQHKVHSAQVCLERYGVKHPMESEDIRRKAIRSKNEKLYEKIMSSNDEVVLLSSKDDFIAKTELTELKWHCTRCGHDFSAKVAFQWRRDGWHWARCLDCYPLSSKCSMKQLELYEYIKSICQDDDIASCDRTSIAPYEIDILDKTKMIGFEFDGLYWHSELAGSRKSLQAKTQMCNDAGIMLVHVFEDEWDMRKQQCKAKIRETLGIYDGICSEFHIAQISKKYAQCFLDENCYDIFAKASTKNFAAVGSNGQILAMAGVSIFNDYATLHNLCYSIDSIDPNVMNSIIHHIASTYAKGKILCIKENGRWPLSNSYGFTICKHTTPSKWIIDVSTMKRTGICYPNSKYPSSFTYVTDCGYDIYVCNNV